MTGDDGHKPLLLQARPGVILPGLKLYLLTVPLCQLGIRPCTPCPQAQNDSLWEFM